MASASSLSVNNFVTLRLKPENYPLWREQVLALAESQDLVGYLTGETPAPPALLPATDLPSTPQSNPEFKKWKTTDRLLRGWIIGTLGEEALGHVIGVETAHDVWASLKEAYAQASQERQFQLTQQLTYMRKDPETSLNDYLRRFKNICDSLATIGHSVSDQTKVFSLLTGLGHKYEPFTTSMLKPPMPSYSEVVPLLQSYETRISLHNHDINTYTAFLTQKSNSKQNSKYTKNQHSFSSKGKGFAPATNSTTKQCSSNSSPVLLSRDHNREISCQICG